MQLLKDRTLNIAILISASWHLVCIFFISPILISVHSRTGSADISFLGSILQRVEAFSEKPFSLNRISPIQKIEMIRNIKSREFAPLDSKYLTEFTLMEPKSVMKAPGVQPDKEKFVFSGNKSIVFKTPYKKKERPGLFFKDILITGEARNRMVLYRPDLPRLSIIPSGFSSDYSVSIRFRISKHGFVENPECFISSGSSVIDQIAIRYIRRWQFAPQDESSKRPQEGMVRVNLETL